MSGLAEDDGEAPPEQGLVVGHQDPDEPVARAARSFAGPGHVNVPDRGRGWPARQPAWSTSPDHTQRFCVT